MIEHSLAKLGFPHEAAVGQLGRIPGLSGHWAAHRCGRALQLSITATSFIVDVVIFALDTTEPCCASADPLVCR
jgi:hypothetical protein